MGLWSSPEKSQRFQMGSLKCLWGGAIHQAVFTLWMWCFCQVVTNSYCRGAFVAHDGSIFISDVWVLCFTQTYKSISVIFHFNTKGWHKLVRKNLTFAHVQIFLCHCIFMDFSEQAFVHVCVHVLVCVCVCRCPCVHKQSPEVDIGSLPL